MGGRNFTLKLGGVYGEGGQRARELSEEGANQIYFSR